jgi:hypothetical protein
MNLILDITASDALRDFFGGLCVALLIFVLREGRKINRIENKKQALLAKTAELERVSVEVDAKFQRDLNELRAQKDEHIQRQQKEINGLHKENARLEAEKKQWEQRDSDSPMSSSSP